jgi:DNA-binding transcriptional regulator of glucitol operon
MTKTEVKIFGAMRSGNNLMKFLLQTNFRAEIITSSAGGWTHGLYRVPEIYGKEVNVVVMSKHPLAWLPSMFRFQRQTMTFHQFATRSGAVGRWNTLYRDWTEVRLEECGMSFVRYEDLIVDPEAVMKRVASEIGAERNSKPFHMPKGKMTTTGKVSDERFDPTYYTERRWMDHYSRDTLSAVIGRFDWEVATRLGYEQEGADR